MHRIFGEKKEVPYLERQNWAVEQAWERWGRAKKRKENKNGGRKTGTNFKFILLGYLQ